MAFARFRTDSMASEGEHCSGRREGEQEARMSTLMIACPKTGQPISTGIETDGRSFDQLPDVLSRSRCPTCGSEHVWWTREAWLSDRPKVTIPQPVLPPQLNKGV